MKRLLSILLLSAAMMFGQTPASTAPATPTPKPPESAAPTSLLIVPTLPGTFHAAGAAYDPVASPSVAGWFNESRVMSAANGLYLSTTYDITSAQAHKFVMQTSLRTGGEIFVRQFKFKVTTIDIFGLVEGGLAAAPTPATTANLVAGTSVGGAFAGGGAALFKLGKSDWYVVAAMRVLKTSIAGSPSSQNVYELGLGKAEK